MLNFFNYKFLYLFLLLLFIIFYKFFVFTFSCEVSDQIYRHYISNISNITDVEKLIKLDLDFIRSYILCTTEIGGIKYYEDYELFLKNINLKKTEDFVRYHIFYFLHNYFAAPIVYDVAIFKDNIYIIKTQIEPNIKNYLYFKINYNFYFELSEKISLENYNNLQNRYFLKQAYVKKYFTTYLAVGFVLIHLKNNNNKYWLALLLYFFLILILLSLFNNQINFECSTNTISGVNCYTEKFFCTNKIFKNFMKIVQEEAANRGIEILYFKTYEDFFKYFPKKLIINSIQVEQYHILYWLPSYIHLTDTTGLNSDEFKCSHLIKFDDKIVFVNSCEFNADSQLTLLKLEEDLSLKIKLKNEFFSKKILDFEYLLKNDFLLDRTNLIVEFLYISKYNEQNSCDNLLLTIKTNKRDVLISRKFFWNLNEWAEFKNKFISSLDEYGVTIEEVEPKIIERTGIFKYLDNLGHINQHHICYIFNKTSKSFEVFHFVGKKDFFYIFKEEFSGNNTALFDQSKIEVLNFLVNNQNFKNNFSIYGKSFDHIKNIFFKN